MQKFDTQKQSQQKNALLVCLTLCCSPNPNLRRRSIVSFRETQIGCIELTLSLPRISTELIVKCVDGYH